MKKRNIKAISPIIATVLLISIAIVLAIIFYSFSINFVEKQKAENEDFSYHYAVELTILMDLDSATLSELGNEDLLILGVRRLDNQDQSNWSSEDKKNMAVKGLRFNFEDNQGNSHSYDTQDTLPDMVGFIYSYDISQDNAGVSNWNDVKKISVRLLYGQNKATDVLDKIEIE